MGQVAPSPSILMTRREVARELSCCEKHIYNLVKRGKLPQLMLGNAPRYERREVEAYISGLRGGDGSAPVSK